MTRDIVVRIAGEGGEGVISTGELLTKAMARASLHVFAFQSYPAEIKGGPAMFQVRAAPWQLLSHGERADVLVAFNREAWDLHHDVLKPDGMLLHDAADEVPGTNGLFRQAVPLTEIASKQVGSKISKNVVALGAVGRLVGVPFDALESVVRDKWARKGEDVVSKNLQALAAGYRFMEEEAPTLVWAIDARRGGRRIVIRGNQAIALGAIAAGCRYYAGYPITPASDILEWMANVLPRFGGVVLQTEDEMAALASCIGASYAGKKAMTASSGPGISLMTEFIGFAAMAEIPVVIVDAQRGGPSTGMPTKTEQSDLNLAVFGGHGDAPRIVLAPANVEDCFSTTARAFELAEKYQTPVIVLTDQYLAQRAESVPYPDLNSLEQVERALPSAEELQNGYRRYRLTESGVSPMAAPGMPDGLYVAEGLEHDEAGHPNLSPANHAKMTHKRHRKLQLAAAEKGFVRRYGAPAAAIGVLGWGSTLGPICEAVAEAEAAGVPVAALHTNMVYPLPDAEVRPFVESVQTLLVPELNYTGQFAQILRARYRTPIEQLNKVEGLPFSSTEILQKILELADGQECR